MNVYKFYSKPKELNNWHPSDPDNFGYAEYRDKNDKLHREDGPASINVDGTREWWRHGERHRDDGPAIIESNGKKVWYKNGLRHREDGPALIYPSGGKDYFLKGIYYSEFEWKIAMEKKLGK